MKNLMEKFIPSPKKKVKQLRSPIRMEINPKLQLNRNFQGENPFLKSPTNPLNQLPNAIPMLPKEYTEEDFERNLENEL